MATAAVAIDGSFIRNNPHNHKFGGSYNVADGGAFNIKSLSLQVIEDSFDVSCRFNFDDFEVLIENGLMQILAQTVDNCWRNPRAVMGWRTGA